MNDLKDEQDRSCKKCETTPGISGRAGPVVGSVGELALIPTYYNTQESRLCTPPWQHNRSNPVSRIVGEPLAKS